MSTNPFKEKFHAQTGITPVILTFDEAPNIDRTLNKLDWASNVIVIDSLSNDATLSICSQYANTTVISRVFDSFADQCNFALAQVKSPWVLSLDADYELSSELVSEICSLSPDEATAGYRVKFIYRIFGQALTGTPYPPRVVLYRRDRAHYRNEGHGHRVAIDGKIRELSGHIYHDDRKPRSRWFTSQCKYATLEADHLLSAEQKTLSFSDKIRLMAWPAPILIGFYVLFIKGCILDGRAGWYYALQRIAAETMIALEIMDRRLRRSRDD